MPNSNDKRLKKGITPYTRPNNKKDYVEPCDICGFVTSRKADMARHAKMHAPDSQKLLCPWEGCTHSTRQNYNLQIHYRTHTGDKPCICQDDPEECDFAVSDPTSLLRHRVRFHGYIPNSNRKNKDKKNMNKRVPGPGASTSGSSSSRPFSGKALTSGSSSSRHFSEVVSGSFSSRPSLPLLIPPSESSRLRTFSSGPGESLSPINGSWDFPSYASEYVDPPEAIFDTMLAGRDFPLVEEDHDCQWQQPSQSSSSFMPTQVTQVEQHTFHWHQTHNNSLHGTQFPTITPLKVGIDMMNIMMSLDPTHPSLNNQNYCDMAASGFWNACYLSGFF